MSPDDELVPFTENIYKKITAQKVDFLAKVPCCILFYFIFSGQAELKKRKK